MKTDKRYNRCRKKDFLYRFAEVIFRKFIEKDRSGKWYSKQVKRNMKILFPVGETEKIKEYYIEKIRLSLLLLLAGVLFTLFLLLSETVQPVIKDNKLRRDDYGGNTQEVAMKVRVGESGQQEMVLKVKERIYDEKQLKELYGKAVKELEKEILGENESLEHVEKDLKLITKLPGYPFRINWECQDYSVIDMDGKLKNANLSDEGTLTGLNAVFTYEKFRAENLFYVHIYPRTLSEKEEKKERLYKALEKADKASENEETFPLPDELDGEILEWSAQDNMQWLYTFVIALCVAVSIYFLKDEDLKKEIKKRERQMRLDYPEVVSKLFVYLGAGMTVRTAWEKIVDDYERNRRRGNRHYIYEEMGITCQEMKSGIPETAAYDRFGTRCGLQLYRKFSTLLIQNLRKGSTSLGKLLKEESRMAFEERKNAAKKAGEEAGTKLLLPMMMMLCIVMLIILLPAFMTF